MSEKTTTKWYAVINDTTQTRVILDQALSRPRAAAHDASASDEQPTRPRPRVTAPKWHARAGAPERQPHMSHSEQRQQPMAQTDKPKTQSPPAARRSSPVSSPDCKQATPARQAKLKDNAGPCVSWSSLKFENEKLSIRHGSKNPSL